jgi:L-lactate dehydrogenase complex protein LldG
VVIADFVAMSTANSCRVHGPLAPTDALSTVTRLVAEHGGGPGGGRVAIADDPVTTALGVAASLADAGTSVLRADDPSWPDALVDAAVGVTGAALGVAETGTLVLMPGPGAPRATSLLPAVHVCLIATADVVATIVDAVTALPSRDLPSAVVWVGGPSRTSDLEMRPTFGIHGPKAVEVVLVEIPGRATSLRA